LQLSQGKVFERGLVNPTTSGSDPNHDNYDKDTDFYRNQLQVPIPDPSSSSSSVSSGSSSSTIKHMVKSSTMGFFRSLSNLTNISEIQEYFGPTEKYY
jgi:hypothetical protein